jgi:dTDP-L-rhamnose 4-epimerase
MRVLITGGVGFIGQHLANALRLVGHDVFALDSLHRQVHADPQQSIARFPGEVIVGDVAEPMTWRSLPVVDHVVHLAAETGTGQSMYQSAQYSRVNIDGTELAADFAATHRIPLLFTSSRAVYGEGSPTRSSHEFDPHHPVSTYGETKSSGEAAALRRLTQGLTIVRPQNVIGPGQALHNPYTGVLAAWLAMAKEKRALTIYGDGLGTRDFVHVADLVAILAYFVSTPAEFTQVYNVGSGVRMTMVSVAQQVLNATPWPEIGVVHLPVERVGDIRHACADLASLTATDAPQPRRNPEEAIREFVQAGWREPGAQSSAWDGALTELTRLGLTREATDSQ